MNWREWWARFSIRERRLILAAGTVLVAALIRYLVVGPFLGYRAGLREEIDGNREMLDNAAAYLARAGEVGRQRELLHARFQEVRGQLVPGDTPTLAAARLQDTLHSLADEKGVSIQSTQVMREEQVGDFHKVAVRITITGDIRQISDFLAGVEYGPQRVSIPFLEISRRGAVLRGQSGRALAATIEVSAILQGADSESAAGAAAASGPGAEAAAVPSEVEGAPQASAPDGTPATPGAPSDPGAPAAAVAPSPRGAGPGPEAPPLGLPSLPGLPGLGVPPAGPPPSPGARAGRGAV